MFGQIIALIFCVAGISFGIFLGVASIIVTIQNCRKSLWSTTFGTITNCEVTQKTNDNSRKYNVARFSYQYSVDDVAFESKTEQIGDFSLVTEDGHQTYSPIGKRITVYYLRKKPKESLLTPPKFHFVNVFFGLVGSAFILLCGNLTRMIIIDIFS